VREAGRPDVHFKKIHVTLPPPTPSQNSRQHIRAEINTDDLTGDGVKGHIAPGINASIQDAPQIAVPDRRP